jgi:hypothetical protein
MNTVLEQVYRVCDSVRERHNDSISFKKLIGSTKTAFSQQLLDIELKTKKDNSLSNDEFYVMAYYDHENDQMNETPIEVVVYHNFAKIVQFQKTQITEFLIQIYDAVVHEIKHQHQSRNRNYQVYSDHPQEPYSAYLSDPDELDAYSLSIAIELLRNMPEKRAEIYMTRLSILSKLRQDGKLVSPNLHAYNSYFKKTNLMKKLAKKVYKHIKSLDKQLIFV